MPRENTRVSSPFVCYSLVTFDEKPTYDILKFQYDSEAFWLVFFVFKSLLGIVRQWSLEKFAILTLKPRIMIEFRYIERGLWPHMGSFLGNKGNPARNPYMRDWSLADQEIAVHVKPSWLSLNGSCLESTNCFPIIFILFTFKLFFYATNPKLTLFSKGCLCIFISNRQSNATDVTHVVKVWVGFELFFWSILRIALFRGIQREYSSKLLKHSIAKRILVFKR